MDDVYEVATVDLDGAPVTGIEPIPARNFAEAVEKYIRYNTPQRYNIATKVAVRIPNTEQFIVFETGSLSL